MLKGRGRDPRFSGSTAPGHLAARPASQTMTRPAQGQTHLTVRTPTLPRAPAAKPEPEYEVVEFQTEQYVNAKLQPPPPPPPRPPTGHPVEASCGLCGGGGARVRCAECGRRALCASCDDMYHRHPKRRHHQRQALSSSQLRDERPPLPPKTTPPVPPPRRHKMSGDRMSASPRPPSTDQRRATLGHLAVNHVQTSTLPLNNQSTQQTQQLPPHLQGKLHQPSVAGHLGSMPYLPTTMQHAPATVHPQQNLGQTQTLGHIPPWTRQRGSLTGFNVPPNMMNQPIPAEQWDNQDAVTHAQGQNWCRPLRRGASVLELGGGTACAGCAHCGPQPWRYGSCANLEAGWGHAWPQMPQCCVVPHVPTHAMMHGHTSHTPQPYRRADSRAVSRAASRTGSRAASPAMSVRSRASRRTKHRTPSPPPLPSSDADSESESDSDRAPPPHQNKEEEEDLGPPPAPPSVSWQCEFCTFVNEAGVRVCAICCRTPTAAPKVAEVTNSMSQLRVQDKLSPSQARLEEPRTKQNGESTKSGHKKERTSTGCGPSPPREERSKKAINRLVTPTRDNADRIEHAKKKLDTGVGPSPPREVSSPKVAPERHSVSVGPSPPRESLSTKVREPVNIEKKSAGTSPPRSADSRPASAARTNVSNTGTSPPPQSISTQTYEVPNTWDRAPSVSQSRSRARRRFRDDARRERSHSRHSMSSDTRESERSARTSRDGRWEWRERERDSSPGAEWSDGERRRQPPALRRRASHLDLHRTRPARRSSVYGSGAGSPEPLSGSRALSLEALVGAGARREAERGLELARLMSEAERLGFSAAEVHAALAQSPAAPLAWLRERWPSLCAGVRAAAARLAPHAHVTELEARAALARHRGAMWPAVTDCVERYRRQAESVAVGSEGRLRGRVWGSPAGADDDAAPPQPGDLSRARAEDSSDEYDDRGPTKFQDDDWMYLPLDTNTNDSNGRDSWSRPPFVQSTEDVAVKLKSLLMQAGVPAIDENLLIRGLLSDSTIFKATQNENNTGSRSQFIDFIQSENDFIDAYNALTRLSPLPNVNKVTNEKKQESNGTELPNPVHHAIKDDSVIRKENTDPALQSSNFDSKVHNSAIKKEKPQSPVLNIAAITHEKIDNDEEITVEDILEPHVSHTAVVTQEPEENKLVANIKISPVIAAVTTSQNVDFQNDKVEDATAHKQTMFHPHEINLKGNPSSKVDKQENISSYSTKKTSSILNQFVKQDEEKSNNLNDIVDNTQKLIQQMKEEINSDINSIGDSNISHSEAETSSNESEFSSEHESSYSDTEEETDNLTSNDEEQDSSSENDEDQITERQKGTTRTSSEENEQFEEAMDHIDDQNEDYKAMDFIGKQIEGFQNTNIEILDSIARSLQEEHTVSVEINKRTIPKKTSQDKNNNIFVQANSFEEIYEELASNSNITKNRNKSSENQEEVFKQNIAEQNVEKQSVLYLPKQEINISLFKPVTATKLIITEQKTQVLHAIAVYTKDLKNIDEIRTVNNNNEEIENVEQKPRNVESDNESTKSSEKSGQSRDHTPETSETYITNNNNLAPNLTKDENIHIIKNNVSPDKTTNSEKNNNSEEGNNTLHKIQTVNNNEISINKNTTKSNIPKLIKIVSSNRTKGDKVSPKVLSSKVPIRRTSLKQYPAPAPPKPHFGNIQSGFVKQLQTRLFNDKFPKTTTNKNAAVIDVKPTTSATSNKKKPAPPPPKPVEIKQSSPPKQSPTKEKKDNYFRETCRTEDEWTESESEEPQLQARNTTAENYRAPSPPPPITLRRVSGQIIDLAGVRLPEGSPERQARMLLAEGATETWEQAQLAVELVSRGTEPPVALLAALECADLDSALAYLHQECELCASKLPEHEMVSMLRCVHRCCRECAHHYFTVQITERSIADCVCPYCKVPELESIPEDAWLEYFAHLDILLKTLLDTDVHELFQRKLRDRTLARDPNFRWCMECSSGFFVHPKQKKLRCPECRSVSCAMCRKPWTQNHEGLSCEQYTKWLEDNDPELSITAVRQHLQENGLECPRCHFKYSLSRGGCMHFTCTQCKYEFCYGCGKPFTMGARCGLSEYCAKLGLHAHHPRNCLFYLRDKEPHELQTLLQMNNVTYETEAPEGCTKRCPIQLQRETPTGLVDGTCGGDVPPKHAGLCKPHYVEYLAGLARGLDPIPIMDVPELVAELRRRALPLPERGPWDTDPIYAGMCAEIVKEKIPLD